MKRSDLKEPFNFSCKDPDFFRRVFLTFVQGSEKDELVRILDLKREGELSHLCDQSALQDSFRLRCQRRSRLIAAYLLDEEGELRKDALASLFAHLEKEPYILCPEGFNDGIFSRQQLRFLKRLKDDPALFKTFKKFQRPLCNKWAERLVRDAIGLSYALAIADSHVRQAVLAACLTLLRQNVGSCFATAPAILIHDEQIENFLSDLYELLMTGKLKRTFGGVEYSVPLCPSSGVGDLKKSIFSNDPNAKIWLSPGLLAAFEVAGSIDPEKKLEDKLELQRRMIFPYLEKGKEIDLDRLIDQILLAQSGLSAAEVEASERRQHAFAVSGQMIVPTNKNDALVEQLLRKKTEAKAVFKAFTDNPLLKAWEYTLASFSEIKMEFSRWNLYSSLGFHHEEEGGIGQIVYRFVEEKLKDTNKKTHDYHREYEIAFDQLRATEILLKQASTESEIRRLQAEYQSRAYHMQACLDMRDRVHARATRYTSFYSFFMEQCDAKFKEYFQEIYDPEMQDVKTTQYDDSPAGFRLVYKHGRSDASLWTSIHNAEEWVAALIDFFKSAESQISANFEEEEQREEIGTLTSQIIVHMRTEQFLETAIIRMGKAHKMTVLKNPLVNLEKMEKKPWAYTSGGTMEVLIKTYFKRENAITEEARWVESASDLLIFILDVLKNQPPSVMDKFLKDSDKGMLMYSPTHAFILHPGWEGLKEGWRDDGFTYTWVRDHFVKPRVDFYAKQLFAPMEQEFLLEQFSSQLLPFDAHRLKSAFSISQEPLTLKEWRQMMVEILGKMFKGQQPLQAIRDKVDSFLYENIPLIPGEKWKNAVRRILQDFLGDKIDAALEQFADKPCEFMTSKGLKETAKGCALLATRSYKSSHDLHRSIAARAQQKGFSAPAPLLFADTNWANNMFAFSVNPGTGELELWRMDMTGSRGMPMSSWKTWLDGSKKIPWGICTRPYEYGS